MNEDLYGHNNKQDEQIKAITDALAVLLSDLATDASLTDDTRTNANEVGQSLADDMARIERGGGLRGVNSAD